MILLRHGQSEFNRVFSVTKRDPGIQDPALTELGHEQATAAAAALAGEDVRRIVASPYTRALQTAAPIGRRLGVAVEVSPLVRERYAFACDVGSPRSSLEAAWPVQDFSAIDEVWWPGAEERKEEVVARAARFRAAMLSSPGWRETLVVSHWGFILALTGRSVANGTWLRVDLEAPAPEAIVWQH